MLKLWFRVALFSATTDDQEVETITGFDLLKEEDAQRVAWQKESSQIFNLLGVSLCASPPDPSLETFFFWSFRV